MYKKVFALCAISLLIIMALVAVACSSNNPGKNIIGKWIIVKEQLVHRDRGPVQNVFIGSGIEFLSDKTYINIAPNNFAPFTNKGTWTILDDGRIKIDGGGKPTFATIQGNQMIIDDPNNSIYKVYKLILEKKTAK